MCKLFQLSSKSAEVTLLLHNTLKVKTASRKAIQVKTIAIIAPAFNLELFPFLKKLPKYISQFPIESLTSVSSSDKDEL